MALARLYEIAAKVEETPGTVASSLFSAANAKHLVIEPRANFEVPLFDPQISRGSLTKFPGTAGIKTGTIGFQVQLAGHGHATPDIPTWDIFLRACGLKSVATTKVAFTGATGVLRHGETVTATGTDASGTAKVVHDTWPDASDAGTLYLEADAIVWASSGATTLTGGTTTAAVTVGAGVESSDAGQSWYPVSQPIVLITGGSVTGSLAAGDILVMANATPIDIQTAGVVHSISGTDLRVRMYTGHPTATAGFKFHKAGESESAPTNYYLMTGSTVVQEDIPTISVASNRDGKLKTIVGARGTMSLAAQIGEPALFTFEFTGGAHAVADQSLLGTAVTYESKKAPVFLGATLALGMESDDGQEDEVAPCITSLNYAQNNEVSPRRCAQSSTGLKMFEITDRSPSGSFDPEQEPEASFAMIGNFLAGEIMRIRAGIGSVAGNRFLITMPGIQATSVGEGNREGIATDDFQYRASGGSWTNAGDTYGADNEFVMTYLL